MNVFLTASIVLAVLGITLMAQEFITLKALKMLISDHKYLKYIRFPIRFPVKFPIKLPAKVPVKVLLRFPLKVPPKFSLKLPVKHIFL